MFKLSGWSCILMLMVGALLGAGPAVHAQEEGATGLTLDEEFARLAEAVPGFGGLYLDAEGTTHVYLKDLSRAREVQDLGERVEVHQGEYDFRDLFAWKSEVRDLLAARGAVFLDIDEQRNRLLFGVEREALDAFTRELETFLRGVRVPPGAVIVEAAEPVVAQEQLTDKIRPVPGGVQIVAARTCTLGVNATRLGVRGFVTNSHCTATRGAVDGAVAFQSTMTASNRIGVETVDPPFFTGSSCPPGRRCRVSDAAFFAYDSKSLSQGGKIANPIICGISGAPGPLLVNPSAPRTSVSKALFSTPFSGTFLMKVGRTTGCTLGAQTNTCVDVIVMDPVPGIPGFSIPTDMTMLCQNRVAAFSQLGDSGSPVFQNQGGKALLAGLLWGGSSTGSGGFFFYSPWLFIFTELGPVVPDLP